MIRIDVACRRDVIFNETNITARKPHRGAGSWCIVDRYARSIGTFCDFLIRWLVFGHVMGGGVDKLHDIKAADADRGDSVQGAASYAATASFNLTDRPAGERIVAAARELFCRDGIHATGIDRILATAAASKMALYSRFGSKEALVREVLQREGAEWRASFFAEVMRAGPDPMSRLLGVVDALEAWFRGGRFYGCSFMNAAAEHSKGEASLRALAAEHHRDVLGFLENIANEAQLSQARMVARQILLIMEGTIASLMVAGDGDVLVIARINLQSILTQAARNSK